MELLWFTSLENADCASTVGLEAPLFSAGRFGAVDFCLTSFPSGVRCISEFSAAEYWSCEQVDPLAKASFKILGLIS